MLSDDNKLEGVMSGRLAYNFPWELAKVDRLIYGDTQYESMTREEIMRDYANYAQQ